MCGIEAPLAQQGSQSLASRSGARAPPLGTARIIIALESFSAPIQPAEERGDLGYLAALVRKFRERQSVRQGGLVPIIAVFSEIEFGAPHERGNAINIARPTRPPLGAPLQRITLFHPAFLLPGGAEYLCVNQARRLTELGYGVRVVTFAFDTARWSKEFEGIELVKLRKRSWKDTLLGWNRGTKLQVRGRRAGLYLRDSDVVVAHNAPCNLMLGSQNFSARRIWQCNEPPRNLHRRLANPRLALRVDTAPENPSDFSTPYWQAVLAQDSKDPRDAQKRAKLGNLDIAMTRQLDSVYAISEFSRDNARQIYGACDDAVVYPFVRFPKGGRKSGPIASEGLQILVQTRLEMLKNVDTVIRGFALYRSQDPKAVLHIVGDGPVRERLERLAHELMPAEACIVHGFLSTADLRAVYERCDVFALLTLDEPFGMVYPEAAARGLLMIGPDHGGPLEILQDGELGHCIDPFAPEALVQALEELRRLSTSEVEKRRELTDRSCRARFGDEAIQASLLRSLGLASLVSN